MKKSAILTIILLGQIYLFNGCKKVEDSDADYLQIVVSPKSNFILPIDDLTKCSSSTSKLSANVIEFNTITLNWTSSSSTFALQNITLTAKSPVFPSGSYSCIIVGSELIALMPTRTIAAAVSGSTSSITSSTFCSLRCGGIALAEGFTSTSIPGEISILGIETITADGTRIPITQKTSVTLNYKKF